MNFQLLEYNKATTSSIDEFSDLIQKTINDNNDLTSFRSYENPNNGAILVELLFGNTRTKQAEVIAFGPDRGDKLVEQAYATISVANEQQKSLLHAGLVAMSKSNRSVCFLVFEKITESKETGSTPSEQTQETKQNSKPNARANRRSKDSA